MNTARLIYLMGPSGAGKNSLIQFIDERQELPIYLPRRVVSRTCSSQPSHYGIDVAVSGATFGQMQATGQFFCHWHTHGGDYGLGLDVGEALRQGMWVLINGSRAHFQVMSGSVQDAVRPVCLNLGLKAQQQSLLAHGHAADDEVLAWLRRSAMLDASLPEYCICLNGEQSVAQIYADFKRSIQWC